MQWLFECCHQIFCFSIEGFFHSLVLSLFFHYILRSVCLILREHLDSSPQVRNRSLLYSHSVLGNAKDCSGGGGVVWDFGDDGLGLGMRSGTLCGMLGNMR